MIGFLPNLQLYLTCSTKKGILNSTHGIAGKPYPLSIKIPKHVRLDKSRGLSLTDGIDRYPLPGGDFIRDKLILKHNCVHFNVQYIGQAYGKDGNRSALKRLMAHEKLQEISLKGIPANHTLFVLMLTLEYTPTMISVFSPNINSKDKISSASDRLLSLSGSEITSLYEASMISYFKPTYNKEFKNSFPSTNLKLLSECYRTDVDNLVCELTSSDVPFAIGSNLVKPSQRHFVDIPLSEESKRQSFFNPTRLQSERD